MAATLITASAQTSAQRRTVATLFTTQSLFSAATIAAFTLTAIVAADLSGRDSLAGVPATIQMLGRAAAAYPIGVLMDRSGRRAGLTVGFAAAIAGLLLSALAIDGGSFLFFCAGAVLIGMGRSASEQSRFIGAEVFPQWQRARIIGILVFAGTIGSVGGPLLVIPATHLAERFAMNTEAGPYLLGAGLMVVALAITFGFLRPDPKTLGALLDSQEEAAHPTTAAKSVRTLRQILGQANVLVALAAMIIGQLVMTLLMVITPLYMRHHDHTTAAISGVIMAHTLGMFGLSAFTGWLIDRLGRAPMIMLGALVLVVSALLAPLSTGVPLLATSLFLLGLGWNFTFIAGSSLLSDALESHERGRVQGVSEALVALASGAGSLGTGGVFAAGGMGAVAAVGLAFSLALIAWAFWIGRRQSALVVPGSLN
ncbi:MAG: MFS transporter [Chloroflexi bacterium]|nr:MAG: MFS transporter [Chloroflexota bacterium]